ncbi:hypothetical protein P7C73_g6095, partial [Tremellales sp. Uapishka_1]
MPRPQAEEDAFVLSDDPDDSDLDELDDDDVAELQSFSGKPKDATSKILTGQLVSPRHKTMTCKVIHERVHQGLLDLNPDYQREVVWIEKKQVGLIESLFLNYFVPPVLFAVVTNDDGEDIRVCIDGKQRCTSICNFMDGKIPFISPGTREHFYYKLAPSARRGRMKLLPQNLKNKFDMFEIPTAEYDHLGTNEQRDIFQRVQLGVALSGAEKLQAIPSQWTDFVNLLQKKYVHAPDTLIEIFSRQNNKWDFTRGKPFQQITAVMMICYEPLKNLTPSAPTMKSFLDRPGAPDRAFQTKMDMTMSIFVDIATNYWSEAFEMDKNPRVAPVEFWFIGTLIFRKMDVMSVRALASHIGEMRRLVRMKHKDIFGNNRTTPTFYEWLYSVGDGELGPNEITAAQSRGGDAYRKRRREVREEDEDPDYREAGRARGVDSEIVNNTRIKKALPKRTSPPAIASRPSIPVPLAVRPPPIGMDAPPPS